VVIQVTHKLLERALLYQTHKIIWRLHVFAVQELLIVFKLEVILMEALTFL
jgi:hypothetical protein